MRTPTSLKPARKLAASLVHASSPSTSTSTPSDPAAPNPNPNEGALKSRSGRQEHVEAPLELERIEDDLFRSVRLYKPSVGPGVYGGQLAALSTRAATLTVAPEMGLHSIHSYFVHPTSNKEPVLFHVQRLRDGRGYCTRQVRATQGSGAHVVFIAICSFARLEPHQTLEHAVPMPKPELSVEEALPAEVKLDKLAEGLTNMMAGRKKRSATMAQMLKQVKEGAKERRRMPIEIRNAFDNSDDLLLADDEGNSQTLWIRARGRVRDDLNFAKCVLVYASDMAVTFTVAKSLGIDSSRSQPRMSKMVSLDHQVHFYVDEDWDPTSWMLYHLECPIAGDGRGVIHGRFYDQQGKLLAVVTQEALVRAVLDEREGDDTGSSKL